MFRMAGNYILVADAATQTGYSREHLRRLAREGTIKSKKVGPVVLIDLASLQKHKRDIEAERQAKVTN